MLTSIAIVSAQLNGFNGIMVRVLTNGLGDLGSISVWVIPKTQKWYLMPPCLTLSIIRYGSRLKLVNPRKGVAPSSTPWCSSYQNRSLQVTLDYVRQLYLLLFYSKLINVCRWSSDYLYCYLTLIIRFNNIHSFAQSTSSKCCNTTLII